MQVVVANPLKCPQDEGARLRLDLLLELTLESVARQTRRDYMAVVCGHVRPERALARHPNTIWLEATYMPPASSQEYRADKHRKRLIIARHVQRMAPLYYMALDGDDLIHRKCVEYVLTKSNNAGFYVNEGYALDFRSGYMAPIPGVWNSPFHQICGSSAIIYLEPRDFPKSADENDASLFTRTQSHTRILANTAKSNRILSPLPFRGAVYIVNNGINISYEIIGEKRMHVVERIAKLRIPDSGPALHRYTSPELFKEVRKNPVFKV
jgi:hypothetical protein